jgi:nucleoside-diphosphate-sugar epimerase
MALMFTEGISGEIFNLGNPEEFTILAFAEKIKGITGCESNIEFSQSPVDDPQMRKPDISKAKEKLRWEPKVNVDEGLSKTVEYYRSLNS